MAFDLTMADAVAGNIASAADYNKHKNNILDLNTRTAVIEAFNANTRLGALETLTGATGSTAAGNAALSTRLGTGVTTASTATSQLTALQTLTGATGLTAAGNAALSSRLGTGVTTSSTATAQFTALDTRLDDAETDIADLQAASGGAAPFMHVQQVTSQTIAAAMTKLIFQSTGDGIVQQRDVTYDFTNQYAVISIAGLYLVQYCVGMGTTTGTHNRSAAVFKNGVGVPGSEMAYAQVSGNNAAINGSVIVRCAINDQIDLRGFNQSSTGTIVTGTSRSTFQVLYTAA
jgi:hypothetical protein